MAITVTSLQTQVDRLIGTTAVTSVTAADRLDAITEAAKSLFNIEFPADIFTESYRFDYLDTLHYYDISASTATPDFMHQADLRIDNEDEHNLPFTWKKPNEFALEINSYEEECATIERRDRKIFLGVNHSPKNEAKVLHNCDSLTGNGTWSAVATTEAENLTADTYEHREGSASLNFDLDVDQAATDTAAIVNSDMAAVDCEEEEDNASLLFEAYIPDVTNFTTPGFVARWGSSSSAYWYNTIVTTDAFGATLANGWNTVKINWNGASTVGSGDSSAINYIYISLAWTNGSEADDTDYRIDNIRMVKPEKLKLLYQTWALGETSTSDTTKVYDFTALTNVPWWSGVYDYLDVFVSHKAAALIFRQLGDLENAIYEERIAASEFEKIQKKFPSRRTVESKNFKPHGVSWDN